MRPSTRGDQPDPAPTRGDQPQRPYRTAALNQRPRTNPRRPTTAAVPDSGAQPETPHQPAATNHSRRAKRRRRGCGWRSPHSAASEAQPHKRRRRPAPRFPRTRVAHRLRGRYWDRTSDLFRVREARYRCANRPRYSGLLEVETGFEPVYTALQAVASPLGHSTSEKAGLPNPLRADDRVRTGDLNLGKVALYQLSYVRVATGFLFPSAREEH